MAANVNYPGAKQIATLEQQRIGNGLHMNSRYRFREGDFSREIVRHGFTKDAADNVYPQL